MAAGWPRRKGAFHIPECKQYHTFTQFAYILRHNRINSFGWHMAFKPRVVKEDDPAPDYDPELVDTIREVLRRAEAGDVKSVLILSEDAEGGYASSVYTESALALLTYARLFAEDEVRELMGMIDSGTLH